MKLELTPTNLLNIAGAIAGGYIVYHLTGGEPIPLHSGRGPRAMHSPKTEAAGAGV